MPTITALDVHKIAGQPPAFDTFYAKCSVTMGQGEMLGFVRVACWPTASPASVTISTLFQNQAGDWEQTNLPFPPMTVGPYQYQFEVSYSSTAKSAVGNMQGT